MSGLVIPTVVSVALGVGSYVFSPNPSIYISASLAVITLWALEWALK